MLKNTVLSHFAKNSFQPLQARLLFEEAPAAAPAPEGVKNENAQGNQENKTPESIPYDRFKSLNDEHKTAKETIAKYQQEAKEREEKEALLRGDHEKIINDLRPQAERAKQLEATIQKVVDTEIAKIPESLRKLVPESLSAEQKLAYIIENAAILTAQPNANVNNGANIPNAQGGGAKPVFTTAQISNIDFYSKNRKEIAEAQRDGRIIDAK